MLQWPRIPENVNALAQGAGAVMKAEEQSLERLHVLAQQIGLDVPQACVPGTLSNMILLEKYVALIMELPLPDVCTPAPEYTP
ncbi:MAG: DUF4089 domain-containing protein [Acetobacter orientalis]|uniref:DUF4089 domain-containing protein n=1 Tax=Acetobacter orientalis TaxID=146474 RepID=UPI0039EAB0B0